MNSPYRSFRRRLSRPLPPRGALTRLSLHFERAQWLVQTYYLLSAYICSQLLLQVGGMTKAQTTWDFLWPLKWVTATGDTNLTLRMLAVAALLSSLLAVQFHALRPVRALFALTFLLAGTIPNSVGSINHPYHAWFWIAALLVLLPDMETASRSREKKMSYVTVIFGAQLLILFFYSMSGAWKLYFGILSAFHGVEGNLSPRGLALTLADRIVQTGTAPLSADFFITNYWLAWPMFLGVMYLQCTAVVVAFRPRLHAVWGYALALFHFGTWMLMEIMFIQHFLFLLLLFVLSPFPARRLDFARGALGFAAVRNNRSEDRRAGS